MTPSQTTPDRIRQRHLLDQVDSVYFLLFPGWESELRGNRWHFAVRWAMRKPVVLVIPTLAGESVRTEPEPRIPNCRILRIQAVDDQPDQLVKDTQVQVGQILEDMERHHFERPLLWCYNWKLVGPFARLPAVARLLHATEAHFDMPRLGPMLPRLRAALAISDLTVAVSSGVASSLRKRIERVDMLTVSNGCDYRQYSKGKPDAALAANHQKFNRIAIYAGNINNRLDFDLLALLASVYQDTLFALYGPVSSLSERDAIAWKELLNRPNVMAPGQVEPDRLPHLYSAADVGIIPYRPDPLLVENGLPLKALEMSATGLPTVTSLMKPLLNMAAGIVVTSTAHEFAAVFSRVSRANLSAVDLAELNRVSSANDYDNKFEQILEALDQHVTEPQATTRVDRLIEVLGPEWFAGEVRMSRWVTMPLPVRIGASVVKALERCVPPPLKRLAPTRLRKLARDRRGD